MCEEEVVQFHVLYVSIWEKVESPRAPESVDVME